MLTVEQYAMLSVIKGRTDSIIDGRVKFESIIFPNSHEVFLRDNDFVEGALFYSVITFQGRVALASYEAQHESP